MAMTISGDNGLTFPAGSTQVQAGNYQTMVNRIINPRMEIDQRNAGASVSNIAGNLYTLDRWTCFGSQASKFTVQQNAGSVTPPVGFTNYLGITSSSAYSVGSSEAFRIAQWIEGFNIADLGFGTANAKTVTVSFWVRSSLTGTFGGQLLNASADRAYPFTYTISSANTWEQKTVTVAGDTTGTWVTNNGAGLLLGFGLGYGSSVSGTANAWNAGTAFMPTGATSVVGTNGATFYITGVDLRVGSYTVVPQDFRAYGTELALCQRYYYLHANAVDDPIAMGTNTTATQMFLTVPFPQRMRAEPTLSAASGTDFYAFYRNSADDTFNSLTLDLVSHTTASLKNDSQISGTAGQSGLVYCRGSFSGVVAFQAEL